MPAPEPHDDDETLIVRKRLPLTIVPQPSDTTCGPTCLHAVYTYYGDSLPLEQVIREVPPLPDGGTLAVLLALHALRRGYDATIYTYNLTVFDPSWFEPGVNMAERLRAQAQAKQNPKLRLATDAYLEFLQLGGQLRFEEMTPSLLSNLLNSGVPILTGLNATYLYGCARERPTDNKFDDIRGEPMGHFVVVHGYELGRNCVWVADPLKNNPGFGEQKYQVSVDRLIGAILLGIVTYDANLLVITPR